MNGDGLDGAELEAAYADHGRGLVRYFARRTYDAEAALDLTAETFARAFQARRRFRGSTPAEVKRWIYTIADNALIDYSRRGRSERRALRRLGLDRPQGDDAGLARVEELAELRAADARRR